MFLYLGPSCSSVAPGLKNSGGRPRSSIPIFLSTDLQQSLAHVFVITELAHLQVLFILPTFYTLLQLFSNVILILDECTVKF